MVLQAAQDDCVNHRPSRCKDNARTLLSSEFSQNPSNLGFNFLRHWEIPRRPPHRLKKAHVSTRIEMTPSDKSRQSSRYSCNPPGTTLMNCSQLFRKMTDSHPRIRSIAIGNFVSLPTLVGSMSNIRNRSFRGIGPRSLLMHHVPNLCQLHRKRLNPSGKLGYLRPCRRNILFIHFSAHRIPLNSNSLQVNLPWFAQAPSLLSRHVASATSHPPLNWRGALAA